jgi:hypothetical protein
MKSIINYRIIGFVLLCSLFSLNIAAQGPGRGQQMTEEDIKDRAEKTAEALDLTDDQHKKILAIDMDFYNKMQIEFQKMRNAERTEETRNVMREKMMKMRDDRNEQYEKVLKPDQYKQFIKMQEQRMNEMRQQRQQRDGSEGEEPTARGRGRN